MCSSRPTNARPKHKKGPPRLAQSARWPSSRSAQIRPTLQCPSTLRATPTPAKNRPAHDSAEEFLPAPAHTTDPTGRFTPRQPRRLASPPGAAVMSPRPARPNRRCVAPLAARSRHRVAPPAARSRHRVAPPARSKPPPRRTARRSKPPPRRTARRSKPPPRRTARPLEAATASHRPPLEAATASHSPAASSVRRFTPSGFAAAAVGASLLRGVGCCACAMGLRVAKVRPA
jgi:hypothetical protein